MAWGGMLGHNRGHPNRWGGATPLGLVLGNLFTATGWGRWGGVGVRVGNPPAMLLTCPPATKWGRGGVAPAPAHSAPLRPRLCWHTRMAVVQVEVAYAGVHCLLCCWGMSSAIYWGH